MYTRMYIYLITVNIFQYLSKHTHFYYCLKCEQSSNKPVKLILPTLEYTHNMYKIFSYMFRHSMGAITRKCSQWLKSCFRNVSVVHTTDHFAGTCGRRFCACVHVPVHVGLTDSTHSEHTDRNIYGSYTDRLLLFFRACSISGVS
jgi:hypothetical protein